MKKQLQVYFVTAFFIRETGIIQKQISIFHLLDVLLGYNKTKFQSMISITFNLNTNEIIKQ